MIQGDAQRNWTALGMLAEVSRVINQVERNDDQAQVQSVPQGTERFELQQQFSAENQEVQAGRESKSRLHCSSAACSFVC